jgi:hypothetical protein
VGDALVAREAEGSGKVAGRLDEFFCGGFEQNLLLIDGTFYRSVLGALVGSRE